MTFATVGSIIRHHIVAIAMAACVTFGWIFTGTYFWPLALLVGLDWFFINLLNRITDAREDIANGVPGANEVALAKRWLEPVFWIFLVGSFGLSQWLYPTLWPWRVAVQLVGLAYSYRFVPTASGLRRLKEIYILKNTGSAALFVVTCFVYPCQAAQFELIFPVAGVVAIAIFFPLYELTYEIIYDLRDLPGDKAEGIPTFPVVHGERISVLIIYALLAASAATLIVAFVVGAIGARELLMLVAPALQLFLLRRWLRRGITHQDCIWLTHLGTALLLVFLAGTYIWLRAGGPANIFIR